MPKSLWYNVNEKTNFVFTAAEGNFLKKIGFSTVIMNLNQKKKMEKRYDLSENIRQKLSKFRQTSPLLYAYWQEKNRDKWKTEKQVMGIYEGNQHACGQTHPFVS